MKKNSNSSKSDDYSNNSNSVIISGSKGNVLINSNNNNSQIITGSNINVGNITNSCTISNNKKAKNYSVICNGKDVTNSNNKNSIIISGDDVFIHTEDLSVAKGENTIIIHCKKGEIVIEGIDEEDNEYITINGKSVDIKK